MHERRRLPRKKISCDVEVFNSDMNEHIGRLVNITIEGMMLISPEPIELEKMYQFGMSLPPEIHGSSTISFKADSLWSDEADVPGHYWTGFQFVHMSRKNIDTIENLIENFGFDE